jgi:precorrin-3B C17-methyltransferase
MTGWLAIAGLGPGAAQLITPEVTAALARGHRPDRLRALCGAGAGDAGLTRHGSDNREEIDRASLALRLAAQGKRVVVVSSGDPGVFAMAAAVFEAVDAGEAFLARSRYQGVARHQRDVRRRGPGRRAART